MDCGLIYQVYSVMAEVASRRDIKYVVYDNACALARYSRHGSRRSWNDLCHKMSKITFVLDRFHKRNHKACLDKEHPQYLPEERFFAGRALIDLEFAFSLPR